MFNFTCYKNLFSIDKDFLTTILTILKSSQHQDTAESVADSMTTVQK